MRNPTIALVAAAAALTSSVVSAAPTPGSYNSEVFAVSKPGSSTDSARVTHPLHPHIGIKEVRDADPDHAPSIHALYKIGPRELLRKALDAFTAGGNAYSGSTSDVSGGTVSNTGREKRADDNGTLGGNAYSGSSGPVDGGDVVNEGDNFGMPTLMNMNSNNAGGGGSSIAGCANGGHGNGRGSGGNAYSGSAGSALGGNVWNSGGVMNIDSNNAGGAGSSESGCATGGDVSDDPQTSA